MKVSYNWLKQYVDFNLTPADLAEILTNTGLEVESFENFSTVKGGLNGVVVGEVIACEQHSNADKLRVATVNVGAEAPLQIVCGAPNCRVGIKTVVALVDTTLYPTAEGFTIKKAKIRGVESFGMLCAEDELGLGKSHDGIIELPENTVVGTPAAAIYGIENDIIYEIGLTPNRSDAHSHIGVARDLVAALAVVYNIDLPLKMPVATIAPTTENLISVTIAANEDCLRYSGVVVNNLTVAASPTWLQNRLLAIGLKPINNVVDITNFVLHEMGQPLHAFDLSAISGNKIIIRKATANSEFKTLDQATVKLQETDLVIANDSEAMCIAGVYGGANSGVKENTTAIFLESAYFSPSTIRKTANRLNLKTDASSHFEKGCDINATLPALERAVALLAELAGGKVASAVVDVYPNPNKGVEVTLAYQRVYALIGEIIPILTIKKILEKLGFAIEKETENELTLRVPTYRTEVTREADVIEEILRIYGVNTVKIPKKLTASLSFSPTIDTVKIENETAQLLAGKGYNEISTNSITQSIFEQDENLKSEQIRLLNSQTAELDSLRTSLLYDGLNVIAHNCNRKNNHLQLFEFGNTYHKVGNEFNQKKHLAIYLTGEKQQQDWLQPALKTDFFHLKETVMAVFSSKGIHPTAHKISEHAPFSFSLDLYVEDTLIAQIGKVAPAVAKKMDVKQDVFFALINWNLVEGKSTFHQIHFKELNKFPTVSRDLAIVLDEEKTFSEVETIVKEEAKKYLKTIALFDVYRGDKIAANQKSYAINFVLADDTKTLSDTEIDKTTQKIIKKLESSLQATLRK